MVGQCLHQASPGLASSTHKVRGAEALGNCRAKTLQAPVVFCYHSALVIRVVKVRVLRFGVVKVVRVVKVGVVRGLG